jgi:hypothetical protein
MQLNNDIQNTIRRTSSGRHIFHPTHQNAATKREKPPMKAAFLMNPGYAWLCHNEEE